MKEAEIFRTVAKRIVESATSEKARLYAVKTVELIMALGDEWIEEHFAELKVNEQDATLSYDEHPFPPEDNRVFFIAAWNRAVAK